MMSPIPLEVVHTEVGNQKREATLHKRFAKHRLHGEWFRVEGDLAVYVETKGRKGK